MSPSSISTEIIGLDLHAKLFEERGEWLRMGPLRVNLRRGSHLEIVSTHDEAIGCLLDILTLRDSNWLGTIRIHGCPMSGLAESDLESFGIAVIGPSSLPTGVTVRSLLHVGTRSDETSFEIFDETPDERIDVSARVSSLDPVSRQWLNLYTVLKSKAALVFVDGRHPVLPRNRVLTGRVLGALMMRGSSLITLSADVGIELTPHAPRIHIPVGRVREEGTSTSLPAGMLSSWWVA